MLASWLSMGAGAYLAARSEAEVYEAEIARENARSKKIREKKFHAAALRSFALVTTLP